MVEVASAADAEFERSVFEDRMVVAANDSGRTVSPLASNSLLRSPRSPDTASHVHPERAIRPMPRSRLKSRLSPEQVSGIIYPPDPPPVSSPLLASTAAENERGPIVNGVRAVHTYANHVHAHEDPHYRHRDVDFGHCTCGEEGEVVDSGDEEVEFDHPDYRYLSAAGTPTPAAYGHTNGNAAHRRLMEAARLGGSKLPPPPGSAVSSADGYESFENTSNKKKRKIPLSSASSTLYQSSLSAEMASMGISGQHDGALDEIGPVAMRSLASSAALDAAASSGTGISGAGRGRYGRSGHVNAQKNGLRRPLGNGTPNMSGGGGPQKGAARVGGDARNGDGTEDHENTGGIISQAIKSAAEQGPLTPQKAATGKASPSQSLLQSATSASSNTTPKTQFTFHCDSESATKMVDHEAAAASAHAAYRASPPSIPGSYPTAPQGAGGVPLPGRAPNGQYAPGTNTAGKRVNSQGTQVTPSLRGAPQPNPNINARPPPPPSGTAPQQRQPPAPAPTPAPKPKPPRRSPSKEYALAARQRQLQQEYTNYHHRPTKDNMWICEFCEYEDIFGVPPLALIRSYEVKDRAERKKAAEKRRLLEKAKTKGRKGKKGGKKNSAANAKAGDPVYSSTHGSLPNGGVGAGGGGQYDPNLPPPPGMGVEGEEYYDDEEYGDEYEPVGAEGEHEDAYYAPPPTPAGTPMGTPLAAGGGQLGHAPAHPPAAGAARA